MKNHRLSGSRADGERAESPSHGSRGEHGTGVRARLRSAGSAAARAWRIWAGAGGLLLVILWTSGACVEKVPPGTVDYVLGFAYAPALATAAATREAVAERIDVVGTAASEEEIHLSARLSAYVRAVNVSAGDAVTSGQTLIVLDDREIREQITAAEARLKRAETEFHRAKRLLDTNATTAQAFDAAESAYRSAKADLDRMRVTLTYASIESPIDGVVTDRRIEVGDLANPGQVLLTVYDAVNMRLEAAVPVRLIDRLRIGETVDVTLERPAGTLRGTVSEIVSEVDPRSRTRQVRIHLEAAGHEILPGTFGRAWISGETYEAVLAPASAVYHVGQLELVQVVRGDRVVRRLVKTGPQYDDRLEILAGLQAGERVLLKPVKED
jgi:RND family efflux transporter MFP subunit